MVSCDWAQKTAATLELKDVNVQFRTYAQARHDLEEDQVCAKMLTRCKHQLI